MGANVGSAMLGGPMGGTISSALGSAIGCTRAANSACGCGALQKYKGCKIVGSGGLPTAPGGRTCCLVVAFDYEGYRAEERAGCPPLTSVADGLRFAYLARSAGAEVLEFYDVKVQGGQGFPQKARILQEMSRIGNTLGPNDVFVFFFAGHGGQRQVSSRAGGQSDNDGVHKTLCFVHQDGTPDFLAEEEVAAVLQAAFRPATRILFVTDLCHGGTVCDLSRRQFDGRMICHLSATRQYQSVEGLAASNGAFTSAMLETIEQLVHEGETRFSVVDVYNVCCGRYNDWEESQDFRLERSRGFDPDTFGWPLVPPRTWQVETPLDKEVMLAGQAFAVPAAVSQLMRGA